MNSKYQSQDIFPDNIYWRLVKLFLNQPYSQFYQSQIAQEIRHKNGAIQPSLKRLVKTGFLNIQLARGKTYYSLNNQFPKLTLISQIIR
ncbi:MAG: hypothetical protein UR93_C0010G0002 [Berkelbacteria bacterium GW2011_GWA2_35_9]|uniref:Transcriptional regulator n=1 Tax=Berkelbacteria bacterium GW2011_GWA2_35_9 TaxID=1618333 RepID=A0A0G0DIN7_9BACT|nr:MAG: hypothetical protein UR93_C0010G0002 [Berkelbacteria bacterium GW2011_GWA2_35_9]